MDSSGALLEHSDLYGGIFPKLSPVGLYSEYFLTPFIRIFDSRQASNFMLSELTLSRAIWFHRIYIHELSHWFEHSSTLWGQKHAVGWFNAIHSRKSEDMGQFWRIVEFAVKARRALSTKYYEKVYEDTWQDRAKDSMKMVMDEGVGWHFGFQGIIQNNYPILLALFKDHQSQALCRLPLCVSSMLEAQATYCEHALLSWVCICRGSFSRQSDSENERLMNAICAETEALIHDPRRLIYSVVAHYVSNHSGNTDFLSIFKLCYCICRICLNLPDRLYDALRLPDIQFFQWNTRVADLFKIKRDPAYAFICLVSAGQNHAVNDVFCWIENALRKAGLPTLAEIEKEVNAEMAQLRESLIPGEEHAIAERFLDAGMYNFECSGILGTSLINEVYGGSKAILPTVFCSDGNGVSPPSRAFLGTKTTLDFIRRVKRYRDIINEFLLGCCVSPLP